MRGVFFECAGKPLVLKKLSDPTPGRCEIVIRVHRCGICGSDVHLIQEPGYYPEQSVIGHEFAGEVVALGADVENFKAGDRVSAMPAAGCGHCLPCLNGAILLCENGVKGFAGGFADYTRISASTAIKLPSSLSMADGALVEPLSVGLHAVALAAMKPGTRVLVLGVGAIGLATIFWARKLGAGKIVAASRSRRRADLACQMGADVFVQTGETEVADVRAALGGAPEVVFEAIGVVGALGQAINHVQPMGNVVSLGFCTKPDPVLPAVSTFKQVNLVFAMAYTLREFQYCADVLDRGHVEPGLMISATIPLEDVPETIAKMQQGDHVAIKVHANPLL